MIIGPKGEIIAEGKQDEGCLISGEILIDELSDFRKKFPVQNDADKFTLNL
jgi:predicted amidohydrolase